MAAVSDNDEFKTLLDEKRGELFVWSFTSLICSVVLCLLYFRFKILRRTPDWLILRSTVCDLAVSVCFLGLCQCQPNAEDEALFYLVRFIAIFDVSAHSCRCFLYMYLLSIYRNPFQPERHRHLYHVWVLCWAVVTFMVDCVVESVCLEDCVPKKLQLMLAIGLFIIPFAVFVVIGGAVHLTVRFLVFYNGLANFRGAGGCSGGGAGGGSIPLVCDHSVATHSNSISSLARQRVSRHGTAYYWLFGLQLSLGLALIVAIALGAETLPRDTHKSLLTTVVILAAGRPAFTFIGWLAINDMLYKLCGCCSIKRWRGPPSGDTRDSVCMDHDRRLALDQHAKMTQGIREIGFKEELRFELLYSVARGLGELAQREFLGPNPYHNRHNRRSTVGRCIPPTSGGRGDHLGSFHIELVPTTPKANAANSNDDEPQVRGASSFDFGLLRAGPGGDGDDDAAALGEHPPPSTRRSMVKATGSTMNPPRANPLPTMKSGSHISMPIEQQVTRTRHYAEQTFREIRDAFGISPFVYAQSFPNDLSELSSDWQNKLKESVSEGASGCFFYRVCTGDDCQTSRLIVKQISKAEKDTLAGMLGAYSKHVKLRKGRSLICYFGCHSMPLSWTFSRKVYFVVMRNFLPVKTWLTFDLKGATANRRALTEDSLYKKGMCSDLKQSYGTLRDWEWLDIAMSVDISTQDRRELVMMIAADAKFLGEQELLDYSLLLGIHRLPRDLSASEAQAHLERMREAGGFISLDQRKVYFFGIIDVLEKYDLRWKAQHAVLKAGYQLACRSPASDGISAMPPSEYADRFRTFLEREVLQCDRIHPMPGGWRSNVDEVEGEENRWVKLWKNRQRGLVRERIEAESADHVASIEELGLQASRYIKRIEELEQVLLERGERSTRHGSLGGGAASSLGFFPAAGRSRGTSLEQMHQAAVSRRSSRRISASTSGGVRFEDDAAREEEDRNEQMHQAAVSRRSSRRISASTAGGVRFEDDAAREEEEEECY